jgi:hypothetical protein
MRRKPGCPWTHDNKTVSEDLDDMDDERALARASDIAGGPGVRHHRYRKRALEAALRSLRLIVLHH